MENNTVYLNGKFTLQSEAKVSIMDRGFLFGDGIYEIIPVFNNHMFGVDQHLQRLKHSLAAIHMQPPHTDEEFKKIFRELLSRNVHLSSSVTIYLQITRGADGIRNHAIPVNATPTVLAFCIPQHKKSTISCEGYAAITREDSRRKDCYIKAIALLPNILLYEEARRAGAFETILIRNGDAIEGTSSNLFIVQNNIIITPPLAHHILSGVTRGIILNLAKQNNIQFQEKNIPASLLFEADEIWMTGSTKEICPITKLDEKPVGGGQVGPMWKKMNDLYEQHKKFLKENEQRQ